jgi:hypothetical protein
MLGAIAAPTLATRHNLAPKWYPHRQIRLKLEPHSAGLIAAIVTTRYDVDPMHKTTSPRRKKFRLLAFASATLLTIGAVAALAAGVTPATAATLAAQPDTQIAVFMVPLTILVVAILYEVARIALRGTLPEQATPLRRRAHRRWSDGQHAG